MSAWKKLNDALPFGLQIRLSPQRLYGSRTSMPNLSSIVLRTCTWVRLTCAGIDADPLSVCAIPWQCLGGDVAVRLESQFPNSSSQLVWTAASASILPALRLCGAHIGFGRQLDQWNFRHTLWPCVSAYLWYNNFELPVPTLVSAGGQCICAPCLLSLLRGEQTLLQLWFAWLALLSAW